MAPCASIPCIPNYRALLFPTLQLVRSFTPSGASGQGSAACVKLASFKAFPILNQLPLAQGREQLAVSLARLREPGFRERKPSTN